MNALRNLLRNKVRNLLTLLGIASGLSVYIAIVSITEDIHSQLDSALETYEADLIVKSRRGSTPLQSEITETQRARLEAHFDTPATPIVLGLLREAWNPYVLVVALPRSMRSRIALVAGRPQTDTGGTLWIGAKAARHLALSPGGMLSLGGAVHEIAGVFRTGSELLDGAVLVDLEQAQQLLGHQAGTAQLYNLLMWHLPTGSVADAARQIEALDPSLQAIPTLEFAGSLASLQTVDSITRLIGLIALIGAVVVLTNTLLMAVAERTREIGILLAVGWTPLRALRMLMAETALLCLVGAALGNLFAWALLNLLGNHAAIGIGWVPAALDPSAVATSFAVAAGIAVVALLWPAFEIARLEPIAAIRQE